MGPHNTAVVAGAADDGPVLPYHGWFPRLDRKRVARVWPQVQRPLRRRRRDRVRARGAIARVHAVYRLCVAAHEPVPSRL